MGKLKDKASKATFRHKDVEIVLDNAALGDRDDLAEGLLGPVDPAAADDSRLALPSEGTEAADQIKADLDGLEQRALDSIITLRIFALPAATWNRLVAENQPREGNTLDVRMGYNIEAITRAAVEAGAKLLDGEDLETPDADDWAAFWPKIVGGTFDRLTEAVRYLNETTGWVGVLGLKKG
jgi:hypothetical protein